jgi:streptogramin lyase
MAAMALALGTAVVPLAVSVPHAAAAETQEIVIQPETRSKPRVDTPKAGGVTGFLHTQEGRDGYLWTDYATGASASVPGLTSLPSSTLVRPVKSDSDQILLWTTGTDSYTLLDPHTGERREMPLPAGYEVRGTTAGKVVAVRGATPTTPAAGVLLGTEPGSTESLPITLPSGAKLNPGAIDPRASDDQGALFWYWQDGGYRFGMLDPTTGVVSPISAVAGFNPMSTTLTEKRIFWWVSTTVYWIPRDDLSASAQEITLPSNANAISVVGDTLLMAQPAVDPIDKFDESVTAWPLNGGQPSTVLDHMASASTLPPFAADHSALIVGGSSAKDWAVHRFTEGADGTLKRKAVESLSPLPADVLGLDLYRGDLTLADDSSYQVSLRKQDVGIGAVPVAGDTEQVATGIPGTIVRCATGSQCVRMMEGNSYGTSFLTIWPDGETTLEARGASQWLTSMPGSGGQVVDAAYDYVVVDGDSPKTQYVLSPAYNKIVRSRPVQAAALWYDTLWSASASTPGTLTAEKLTIDATTPGAPTRTVTTGVACVPTELQATARWLYWSCGEGKQAGVYDLTNNRGFEVPSGQSMLGDGYVVRHDRAAGELKLTDFHTGTPVAERTVAPLADGGLPDDRRITWAVDKYSGHIAWVDADQRVHVGADGVPNAFPAVGKLETVDLIEGPQYPETNWVPSVSLARPVDSWEMNVYSTITGNRMATFKGGATRGHEPLKISWDGMEPNGAPAASGPYIWKLTVTYDGKATAVQIGSRALTVKCGRLLTHVYDCDGIPDLMTVRPDGATNAWTGLSNGSFRNDGVFATWPTSSTLVPIGDLNGDGFADILVRDSAGDVRAYWGRTARIGFSPSDEYFSISTGWNKYNVLTSPGDLTGDGRADLVARETTGDLWLYPANNNNTFNARIKIGSGQGGYTAMVGVGDLNGDGRGDLVARDPAGDLWRLPGGESRFDAKVKISSGFNAYNAIIGIGDITQDGKNDLLTTDTAGNLYRWAGDGTGGFGTRTTIGTGWNTYKSLV